MFLNTQITVNKYFPHVFYQRSAEGNISHMFLIKHQLNERCPTCFSHVSYHVSHMFLTCFLSKHQLNQRCPTCFSHVSYQTSAEWNISHVFLIKHQLNQICPTCVLSNNQLNEIFPTCFLWKHVCKYTPTNTYYPNIILQWQILCNSTIGLNKQYLWSSTSVK